MARPIRVLIVDDHEVVRAGLRILLEDEEDIEIVADVATGSQALVYARRLRPDVVLLDARLPDMPGPEVCRALRAAIPGVFVAILTTFTDDDLVRQCVRRRRPRLHAQGDRPARPVLRGPRTRAG